MRFSQEAWFRIERLFQTIVKHPFNHELAAGTLARGRFQWYLLQDSFYLFAFSKALALAVTRARRPDEIAFLAENVRDTMLVERALHDQFYRAYGITEDEVAGTTPSPTCLAYSNLLLVTGYEEPYPVILAALLPCFWVYWEVGKAIAATSIPGNPYQAWIDTYAGEEFAGVVQRFMDLTDRHAETVDAPLRERMLEVFVRSSRFEWMFWDSAYRLEGWVEV